MVEARTSVPAGDSGLRRFVVSGRGRRLAGWLLGLMLAFGVLGYFAGPPLLKSLLVDQVSRELNRQVSIGDIAINPYALSAEIAAFSVKAADGREVAGFDRLQVNLSTASLFKLAVVADQDDAPLRA